MKIANIFNNSYNKQVIGIIALKELYNSNGNVNFDKELICNFVKL